MQVNAIYLDHNASTPPASEVVEAMLPWLGSAHANPHAEHLAGRRAAAAIDLAVEQMADLIGADPHDIVLTSGATESNNLALQGILRENGQNLALWYSAIEHKSVLEVAAFLAQSGVPTRRISVDRMGHVNLKELRDGGGGYRPFVSLMHANNEIGTIQKIGEASKLVAELEGIFHVDASQSCGRVSVSVDEAGIDLLSISSHKMYGPAGIGALFVSPRIRPYIRPLLFGGGQQDGLRSGTVPVFLAVGFGAACALAKRRLDEDAEAAELLAERFCDVLRSSGVGFDILGDPTCRLPGLRSIRIDGIDGDDLVARLASKLSLSTGSACASGEIRTSHVLHAIGLTDSEARSVIRAGFGRNTTFAQAQSAAMLLCEALNPT